MPAEHSAGAIIFHQQPSKEREYLLLHYQSGARRPGKDYWDLPKGHIEKGEGIEQTARREVKEETGLDDLSFIPGFKQTLKYFFRKQEKTVFKTVTFLLAETKTKQARISFEHIDFAWLPYEKALTQLTFKNAKTILQKAEQFLQSGARPPLSR